MIDKADDVQLLRELRGSGTVQDRYWPMLGKLDDHIREMMLRSGGAWPFYVYEAMVAPEARHPDGVIDGDTVVVDLDNGLQQWVHAERLRLFGIDAPELHGEDKQDGLESKSHLVYLVRRYLPETRAGFQCVVRTIKDRRGKYGRYYGELWTPDRELCLNALMVAHGFATWAWF